jgi:hypothetical protein
VVITIYKFEIKIVSVTGLFIEQKPEGPGYDLPVKPSLNFRPAASVFSDFGLSKNDFKRMIRYLFKKID